MLDLGVVRPGSTIRIPFSTFDKDDGSSITMTNFAVGDILVYKDGNTTARASTNGFTATTDFSSKTGKQLITIDLADNSTADFYAAGSEYLIAIDAVTVDSVTTGAWVARFRIGYPSAVYDTTIATLSSQTSFTLTTGPAEDDALNGMLAVIHDAASAVQFSVVQVSDYTGSTKTVTLAAGATFTVAAKDNISFMRKELQSGDAYAIVSSGTHGNAVLKTLIDTVDDLLDTEVASIKAKTDNLPSDPADASDVAASIASLASSLATVLAAVDTEVAAIKTKTDQLTFTNANKVDASTLVFGSGVIDAASIATDAIGAAELSAAACAKIADILIRRTLANIAASSDGDAISLRSLYGVACKLVNKLSTVESAGKLTIYREDDSTVLGRQTLTTNASADPITVADTD